MYSYKQPTLFSFAIDGGSIQGHDQWHIPSFNERNEQKYLYKIDALDVYLWTEKDATAFLGHLKTVIPADKLELKDVPASAQLPAEHRDSMSPVVQQLEKTAIGTQFPARAESTHSAQSLPGPPTPATSAGTATSPQPAQSAPMAYNPAAPAAPEPIAYREKTPPPPDAATGTGLAGPPQQQYANVPNTFQPSGQPTPQQSYFTGPPSQQQIRHPSISGFPGPPQHTPPQRTASGVGSFPPPPPGGPSPQPYNPSFAPPPGTGHPQPSSPPPNQTSFNRQSSYGALPGQTQYANYPSHLQQQPQSTPSFGPGALASPGLPGTPGYPPSQQPPTPSAPPAYSSTPGQYQPGQPSQQQQPGQPQQVFSYSNYSYTQQQQQPASGYNPAAPNAGYGGDVHSQVYRPTESEALAQGQRPQQPGRQTSETRQKLEQRTAQVEAGVGKFMKRLDKLW